jgi:hypothetical protein
MIGIKYSDAQLIFELAWYHNLLNFDEFPYNNFKIQQ